MVVHLFKLRSCEARARLTFENRVQLRDPLDAKAIFATECSCVIAADTRPVIVGGSATEIYLKPATDPLQVPRAHILMKYRARMRQIANRAQELLHRLQI